INESVHVSTSGPEGYNSWIRVNYAGKFVEYNQTELDFMPESIGNYNVVALLSYEDDCNSLSKFLTARFKVSDIKLEEEKKDIIDIVDLSVETNKEIYFQDEAVYMMLPSNVSRLKVIHKEAIFSYLDIIENISFRPPYPGDYKIKATVYMNGLPHILVTNFSVVDTAVSEVEMEELSLVNLTEISEWLIIETDKEKYDLGDAVQIISNANIIELKLRHKEGVFGYLGEFTRNITFRPQYIGDYIIEVKTVENGLVKTLTAEFYVDNVSVDDISLAYLPKPKPEKKELRFIIKNSKNEKLNSVIRILDKRNKSVRDKGGKKAIGMASVDDTMEMMEYDLEVIPEEQPIRKILFKNLEASENESLELRFEEVEKDKVNVPVKNVRNSFAIDPSKLKFSEAEITVIAKGTELYKCKDWNFSEQRCYGSWEKIMDLVPGKEYHINITADDPAFAEIGLIAINTHKSIYLPDETAFIGIGILD
ncbi:MAG: hypothetical protein KAQ85_11795, partial [Thermodesulfovibrionia bacterium]|nr:hypothetical protein [Thermodesulfovibrionia bacterium]